MNKQGCEVKSFHVWGKAILRKSRKARPDGATWRTVSLAEKFTDNRDENRTSIRKVGHQEPELEQRMTP